MLKLGELLIVELSAVSNTSLHSVGYYIAKVHSTLFVLRKYTVNDTQHGHGENSMTFESVFKNSLYFHKVSNPERLVGDKGIYLSNVNQHNTHPTHTVHLQQIKHKDWARHLNIMAKNTYCFYNSNGFNIQIL